jgi:arylsulfatase A-like enzyme
MVVLSADPMEPYGAPSPVGDSFISGPEREWYLEARRRLMAARPGPLGLATSGDLKRLKIDPDRFARAARGIYDGAILHNDQRIADLRRELESRDLWKKSLFAVTSTHGVEFGEWGMFGHGMSLYDTSIRVPLVITFPPGVPRASQMRRACDTVDLMPTLLSMLGLPIPEGVQGIPRNIEPTSPETVGLYDRPAFAETSPAGALPTGTASMVAESAVKLILYQEPAAGIEKPEMELFRLPDPVGWEKRNMVPFLPQIASKYREILDGWRASKGKLVLPPDASPAASPRQLPEILRSLGYLQGSSPAPVSGTGSR